MAAATPLTACTKCGHNMGRSKCRPTGKTYRGWPTWIVRDYATTHGASVHAPRIGCGLAGGRWQVVEPLIEETLCAHGVDVTVYDLEPPR